MNWFYAKDGQQAGPVDDAELDRLVTTGDIADSTLVWHSGLPNWQPYAAVHVGAGVGGVATAPAFGTGAVQVGPGQAQCSQCGRVLPADEVVRIDNLDVCAGCKPGFIQRLREGAFTGAAVRRVRHPVGRGRPGRPDPHPGVRPVRRRAGGLRAAPTPRSCNRTSSAALTFQVFNLGLNLVLISLPRALQRVLREPLRRHTRQAHLPAADRQGRRRQGVLRACPGPVLRRRSSADSSLSVISSSFSTIRSVPCTT